MIITPFIILIHGLPGSGKTTFADGLAKFLQMQNLSSKRINADEVRAANNDWDFSEEGRSRQAKRMRMIAQEGKSQISISDFVAPTEHLRELFKPDLNVWMNTISASRFSDTDKIFEIPKTPDIVVKNRNDASYEEAFLKCLQLFAIRTASK